MRKLQRRPLKPGSQSMLDGLQYEVDNAERPKSRPRGSGLAATAPPAPPSRRPPHLELDGAWPPALYVLRGQRRLWHRPFPAQGLPTPRYLPLAQLFPCLRPLQQQ